MSKLKNPQDKKLASLKKDRRNVYGENDKSSRKNIPRSKQRQHQVERRPIKTALLSVSKHQDNDEMDDSMFAAESRTIAKSRAGFAKRPDAYLVDVLSWKKTGEVIATKSKGKQRSLDAFRRVVRF
jgi:hypothetical protein